MTTKYSNWLVSKIVDKEAEMVAMRKQFLRDNREKPDEDNYEFKRRDSDDKVPIIEEINDQQKKKRLKTKWSSYILALNMFILKVDIKTLMFRNYLGFAS